MATLTGKVATVTEEGDLVTDIDVAAMQDAPRDENLKIECDGHTTFGLYPRDHGQPDMTLLAFENQQQQVQICIVGGSASGFLGIRAGADVVLRW